MNFWSFIVVCIKVSLVIIGLSWVLGGPSYENGDFSNKFHKFTDPMAAIFRALGLVSVIMVAIWLFSDRAAIKADSTAQAVFGIGTLIGASLSLVLIIVGRPAIGWLKMEDIVNQELLPARIWGLIYLVGFVVMLIWIVA